MRFTGLVAASILAFSCLAFASSRSQKAHGAQVFADTGCTHCHSIKNVGGHRGPDLSGVGRRKTKAELERQIVFGSKVMPAFGDDLGPGDLKDLIAYLKSCRQKPAKTPQPANNPKTTPQVTDSN